MTHSSRNSLFWEVEPNRFLVRTSCHDCFIDVVGWSDPDRGYLFLSLLSHHGGTWASTLGFRIKDAWRALRGRPEPYMDILDREEAEATIACLSKAMEAAFPLGPIASAPGSTSTSVSYPDDFRKAQ